jgi:4-diphosphocytidyl-2-C-methyl-D-erythritol kinase
MLTPLPPPPPCWVVLAKPVHGVSTADVFRNLRVDHIEEHPSAQAMAQAMKDKDYEAMNNLLGNVLEPVTMNMYPEVQKIKQKMIQFGADGVLMSGSGPTVFGLVKQEYRARRIVNSLNGFCQHVFAVRMLGYLD